MVLLGDFLEKLLRFVNKFRKMCKSGKLKANTGKNKVMRGTKNLRSGKSDMTMKGESMEEENFFKYLGLIYQ